jgi:hypothetical protein
MPSSSAGTEISRYSKTAFPIQPTPQLVNASSGAPLGSAGLVLLTFWTSLNYDCSYYPAQVMLGSSDTAAVLTWLNVRGCPLRLHLDSGDANVNSGWRIYDLK